ncbi:DDE-type integrase/transposase/recombinase [Candidatus Woesearchaeota archaeon]|nr:DDE-type integrase/transposase/recombinase [Candidatus Woesearchaeota archaeon]
MEKEILRREFLKLKCKYSYSKCQLLLKTKFDVEISVKSLKRWYKRFKEENIWDFGDKSRCPNKIYYKVTNEIEKEILFWRNEYGWSAKKIKHKLSCQLSHFTINETLRRNNLLRKEHVRGQRKKYVRFERTHCNSLWHIDDSEFGEEGKIIGVTDDKSRYAIGILHSNTVTTMIVTEFLDSLIVKYGKPRAIISDNGSPYGLKSKHSKFDVWCLRRGIEHIRTKVKRPQTNGKVERFFGTTKSEFDKYAKGDLERFRYVYNEIRPHESLDYKTPSEVFNNIENWKGSLIQDELDKKSKK